MEEILAQVLQGNVRIAARLMRDVDDRRPEALELMKQVFLHSGKALIVGITGNPGAGKSTVVDALITNYRRKGWKVGVVAVDPTSPFSGGAILGDRIRMQRHATDPNVFIRSLATRGKLGGLSRSTFDVVSILDAMGYDRILVETVGVGQDEVDVMQAAHLSVVVTVPGLGDDIQAIKAGILEIADVLVLNKADREGVDRAERDLLHMLDLRAEGENKNVEIIRTIASLGLKEGSGIQELADTLERVLKSSAAAREKRLHRQSQAHISELVRALLADKAEEVLSNFGGIADLARDVAARKKDPYTVAHMIIDETL